MFFGLCSLLLLPFFFDLGRKIKRDRIGQEIKKALTSQRPSIFVEVLVRAGLFDVVFIGNYENEQDMERASDALKRCQIVEKLCTQEQVKKRK